MSRTEAALRRRVEAGDASAGYELGRLLESRGATAEALKCWMNAAAAGSAPAATNVGVRLARAEKIDEARKWFELGADGGDARAAYNLGLLWHRRGDLTEAERWWRTAADRGDATSASNVGELLRDRGELQAAEEWWRRGAEGGDFSGAWYLGQYLYESSRLDEAEVWLRRCAREGDPQAAATLSALLAKLEKSEPQSRGAGDVADAAARTPADDLLFTAITHRAAGDRHLAQGAAALAAAEFVESLDALAQLADAGDPDRKVTALMGATATQAGYAFRALGARERAESCFRQAYNVFTALDPNGVHLATALSNLGVVHFEAGEYAAAIPLLERALELDDAIDPWSAETSRDLNNLGNAYQDSGDAARALSLLERACDIERERNPASLDLAISLRNLATCHRLLGDYALAAQQLERARAIYEAAAPASPDLRETMTSLAGALLDGGRPDAALELYRAVLRLEEHDDPTSETTARALGELANALMRLDRQPEAQPLLERARDLYGAYDTGTDAFAETLNSLGRVYLMQGDTAAAYDSHRRSLELHRENGSDSRAIVRDLINIGGVYEEQGDVASALAYYEEALASAGANDPGLLYILTNIGEMRKSTFDVAGALEVWERALALARERGERLQEARLLKAMAEAVSMRAEFTRARELYDHAIPIVEELAPGSVQLSTLYGSLSVHLWIVGDQSGALDYAEKAVDIIRATLPRSRGAALTLDHLGLCLNAAGRRTEAIAVLEEAIEITEALRARAGTAAGQEGIFSLHQSPYETLVLTLAGERDVAKAFHYAERGRARTLVELLAERRVSIAPESEEHRALLDDEKMLQGRLAVLYNTGAHDSAEAHETRGRLDAIRHRLRREFAQYAQIEYPTPIEIDDVRARLDQRTLLLEIEVTAVATIVWTVRGGDASFGLAVAPMGAHDLEALVERAVGAYRRAGGGRGRAPALKPPARIAETLAQGAAERTAARAELARVLLQSIPRDHWKDVERVVIVPDGPLHYLPFELLPLPHDPAVLLGDRYPLGYAPSATALVTLLDEPAHPQDPTRVLLGFGDPAFGPGPAGDALQEAGLARLGGTRREIERIEAALGAGAQTYVDRDATEARVQAEAAGYRYVHFATHGLLDDRDPLYSGLALAPPEPGDAEHDDFLQVYELFNLRLTADLVVCSACQTGLGPIRAGEGLVGMTRALFFAGARCVIVSLWPVPDGPTALLMEALYAGLRAGDSPAEALRAARMSVRAEPDPFAWGGFVPIGLAFDRL